MKVFIGSRIIDVHHVYQVDDSKEKRNGRKFVGFKVLINLYSSSFEI